MKPGEEHYKVARRLLNIIPRLLHGLSNELRHSGGEQELVTMAQLQAMTHLKQQVYSLNDLARMHEVSPASMSRLISTLVERGWVRREPDPVDRRQVRLLLTAEGEQIWQTIAEHAVRFLASTLSALSDEEIAALDRGLLGLTRISSSNHPPTR